MAGVFDLELNEAPGDKDDISDEETVDFETDHIEVRFGSKTKFQFSDTDRMDNDTHSDSLFTLLVSADIGRKVEWMDKFSLLFH